MPWMTSLAKQRICSRRIQSNRARPRSFRGLKAQLALKSLRALSAARRPSLGWIEKALNQG